MIISPQSLDTNLSQLLAEVKFGSMQLPEFQRDWTWDDNRIRGIIASLSQGYPMGAIMRLQYGNPDIQFKYRTITGVKGVSVKPEHLILDGQQRLTSIYQATSSKEPVSTKTEKGKAIKRYYYLSMEKCLDDDEDRFDAVLSIPEDRKIKENFDRDVKLDLSTREYEYENKLFPVNIVFDSNAVMDWFMGYMTHYGMKPEAMDEFKRFQADVLNTISGYKLPVITLDKSTPREAVCKVFENVNTGGVPLTVFELVTATYATRDFDLRKDWVQCRNTICGFGDTLRTDLFDGIDETTFLTTVCLYTSYLNKQSGKTNTISCKKKDVLGLPYESYVYGPDVERNYHSPLYEDVLLLSLHRINKSLPMDALTEAVYKLKNFETGTLLQKNMVFMDYLQNGVPVKYYDKGEERSTLVYLVDFKNPASNEFTEYFQDTRWVSSVFRGQKGD